MSGKIDVRDIPADVRRKLGSAGRDRARTHFSWERVTDATLAAYAEAVGTMES